MQFTQSEASVAGVALSMVFPAWQLVHTPAAAMAPEAEA
jgi:hypothetical protein